ncbi:hypothetical protein [Nocardia sp. NPDC004604]|uniref:hypothetical protein n=1 Tax=Nocardia sp. NPDC004604 TaxID=3157013 RepID=UPI0033AB9D76
MDYAYEIDCVVEEHLRGVRRLQQEYEDMRQSLSGHGGAEVLAAVEQARAEYAEQERLAAEEKERLEVEARAEQERVAAEAREQREAIARSIAARKAQDVVMPIDDEGDEESEYYRRKSWLV